VRRPHLGEACAASPKVQHDPHEGRGRHGDVVHAVKHIRQIVQEMKILTVLGEEELYAKAKEHQAPTS